MSRLSSAFILSASLAVFGLGAPLAFAQPATNEMPSMSISQYSTMPASQLHPMTVQVQITKSAPVHCFMEDLNPGDDSSMLSICSASASPKIIFIP